MKFVKEFLQKRSDQAALRISAAREESSELVKRMVDYAGDFGAHSPNEASFTDRLTQSAQSAGASISK